MHYPGCVLVQNDFIAVVCQGLYTSVMLKITISSVFLCYYYNLINLVCRLMIENYNIWVTDIQYQTWFRPVKLNTNQIISSVSMVVLFKYTFTNLHNSKLFKKYILKISWWKQASLFNKIRFKRPYPGKLSYFYFLYWIQLGKTEKVRVQMWL